MSDKIQNIDEVLNNLYDESADVRMDTVLALSRSSCDEAVAGLVIAMEDVDGAIREAAADALASVSGETTTLLLSEVLGAENIRTRNLAAEVLVRIGKDAVPGLLGWLNHEHHDVRKFVVDVLGLIGDERACEGLCESLTDPNINVVCSVAEALGLIGEPAACEPLIVAAERNGAIRPQAIEALGRIGDPRAVEFLVQFLKSGDPLLMFASAEALGKIGSPQALKELSEIVNSDSVEVAEEAFRSALRISEAIRVDLKDHISDERLRRFIVDGLVEADPDIVPWALRSADIWIDDGMVDEALAQLGSMSEEVRSPLVRSLEQWRHGVDERVMRALNNASEKDICIYLDTLCEIECGSPCIDALKKFVGNENPTIRERVAKTLGRTHDSEALEPLLTLTGDSVGHVRSQAYMSLGWVGDDRALEALIVGLDDKYEDVREVCVGAMVAIGGSRVISQFCKDLDHTSAERSRLAAAALGWVGEKESGPPLIKALSHSMAAVRKEALQALTRMGVRPEYDDLLLMINDEDASVQRVAILALVAFYPEQTVSALRPFLNDDDIWLSIHIISALCELRSAEVNSLLKELANAGPMEVRIAAVNSIADRNDAEFSAFLETLETENNEDLNTARKKALTLLKEHLNHEPA